MARKPKAGGAPSGKTPLATAQAALRRAQADVARLKAEAAEAEEDGDPVEDPASPPAEDAPDPIEDEADEDDADEDEDEEDDEEAEADATSNASASASAIAASPEAAAHPKLALAAISSGLSLKQFKATAAAAGPQASGGRIGRMMAGSRRLGPDSAKAAEGQGSALTRRAEQRRKGGDG